MTCGKVRLPLCALLLSSCFSLTATAQFHVVENFTLNSNGKSAGLSDSDVSAYLAQNAIAGAVRNVAIIGLRSVQDLNQKYLIPMQTIESQIPYVQRNSDSASARAIAKQLLDQWNRLQGDNLLKGAHLCFHDSGLTDVDNSFTKYLTPISILKTQMQLTADLQHQY